MKKNIALLVGVITFVLLFYKKEPGINVGIFSLLVWGCVFIVSNHRKRTLVFWGLSAAVWGTALGFAWYGDFPSFIALFFSLTLFIVKTFYPKLNILFYPFVLIISGASSFIRVFFFKYWLPVSNKLKTDFVKKTLAYFIVPLFFVLIFLLLYSRASYRFASFLKFDWNINNLLIVFGLTLLGMFFMFNFLHVYIPRFLSKENFRLQENYVVGNGSLSVMNSKNNKKFIRQSGEITLVLLNLILVFFIIVYATESFKDVVPTVSYSSEVHERVYVLISSIVIAVAIIMIYFQSVSNFNRVGYVLRVLSYIWIGLNVCLVAIAIFKNMEYIAFYGLTFKRIGVFIFLLLSLVGLAITLLKLLLVKTNIFLLNRMAWVFFITLIVGVNINWSWVVTKYNITYQSKPDFSYLASLDYNKEILVNAYPDSIDKESFVMEVNRRIKSEKLRPYLSRTLYYECLKINEHEKR
ncbi:MAG: DUF4153 domain-containing protein [Niabella sp.]